MKVLVNALSARKGGIVTYTNNLLTAFEERGIDVTVAVSEEFEARDRESISRLNISRYSAIKRLLWEQSTWRRFVKKHNPDVLFSSANFGLLNCPVKQILLLREGGLFDPFYLANMTAPQGVWNAVNRYFRRNLMLMSAMTADQIITPTQAMRDMVLKWQPKIAENCAVNPYGTIDQVFKPTEEKKRIWREDGVLKLLYVSVYYPHKVPNLICQAVDQLTKLGIRTHATITMSIDEFGEMDGSVLDEAIVRDANRRGMITLGHHDYGDLPKLYRSHDVFVFPSVSETFGHPMAEAMSSAMPVVVSDTPVNREICGDAALYFEPFMVSQLIEKLLEFDRDPLLRERLLNLGRERVVSRFGWDGHFDRLIETMKQIVAS